MVGLPFGVVVIDRGSRYGTQESLGRRYSRVAASVLELDHVVTNRPEIGKVVDIPSKLLDDCIAQTQR